MSTLSSNDFYSIDEITANCMTLLPGSTPDDRLYVRQWASLALRDIGPSTDWVKVCEIFPKNGQFEKPKDMVSVIDISLWDSSSCEIPYNFHPSTGSRIHVNRFDVFADATATQTLPTGTRLAHRLDLADDAYHFNLGGNGWQSVNYALIRYFSMPVDTNGMPMVPEPNVIPLMMFCKYMWSTRKGDNQSELQLAKQTWYEERDRAKGRNKMPNELEAKAIFKSWLSMISSPKFDIS